MPFLYLTKTTEYAERELADRHIHFGYNTFDNSMIDVGLTRKLSDDELMSWLYLIAGEAVERWRLPGFELPDSTPDLLQRIQALWKFNVVPMTRKNLDSVKDYPFNGLCGGLPHRNDSIPVGSLEISKAG